MMMMIVMMMVLLPMNMDDVLWDWIQFGGWRDGLHVM